jgi:hypothetical protein
MKSRRSSCRWRWIRERDEIDGAYVERALREQRAAFAGAQILCSRIRELESLLQLATRYPESQRLSNIRSLYADGDGTLDALDDCPLISGAQLDTDSDGVGDACDHADPVDLSDPTGCAAWVATCR